MAYQLSEKVSTTRLLSACATSPAAEGGAFVLRIGWIDPLAMYHDFAAVPPEESNMHSASVDIGDQGDRYASHAGAEAPPDLEA